MTITNELDLSSKGTMERCAETSNGLSCGRARSGLVKHPETDPVDKVRAARAAKQIRKGGQFQKAPANKEVVIWTGKQRAKAALDASQKKFEQYIEKTKRESAAEVEQWKQHSAVTTSKIAALEKEVKSLRRQNLISEHVEGQSKPPTGFPGNCMVVQVPTPSTST
jgi:hypothetical protein